MLTDEHIDDYNWNRLSPQDRRVMEAQLLQDRHWAAYVAEYTQLTDAIKSYGWTGWESQIAATESELADQGFFLTDDELDDYLSGSTEAEATEQIEQLRFNNSVFAARLDALANIRRAMRYAGHFQWESLLDKAEEDLQTQHFFEQTHHFITEKMPKPMSPIVKALIAVVLLLVLILLLRWLL